MTLRIKEYWTPFVLLASAIFLSASCGNGGQAPEAREPVKKALGKEDLSHPKKGAGSMGGLGGAPELVKEEKLIPRVDSKYEMRFDFVENAHLAHIRSGGLLVDMGTTSRHKYTLGDWKTGWRGNYEKDGVTFTYAGSSTARLFFDASEEDAGGGQITLRAKGVGSTNGRVYLNGTQVGTVKLSKDEYGHTAVSFDKGIVPGKNEVMFRFNTRRPGHDGKAASIAVDYVRISTKSDQEGPSLARADAVIAGEGESKGFVLAGGEKVTFNLPIPNKAVIRGLLKSTGGGKLIVSARGDLGETRTVKEIKATRRGVTLAVQLEEDWKKNAALTFQASKGEVVLEGLSLHVPKGKLNPASGKTTAENVVLVLIDTLRADHLALYKEGSRVKTPYMDKLGDESMVFNRVLAQENWTKPSIATLLTGLYPETHNTKTEKHRLPSTATMMSEYFKSEGYATAGFVANGYISNKFGFERGWDAWRNYVREGKPNRAQFVMKDARSWLEKRPKDKPFFLYVHTIDPHVPYIPPSKYRALYDDEPYNGQVSARNTAKLLEGIKTGAVKLSARDRFRLEALYDGEISYHDYYFAGLQEMLKEQDLLKDTILVVTADHGEEFFEHGSVGHGHSMYEEMLHVPLIIRLAGDDGERKGARSTAEVGLIDIFPTVCEILEEECPGGLEGRSLVPLLEGREADRWPQVSFSDFMNGQRVARMDTDKLIYRGLSTTLFDLKTDPRETVDLSDEKPVTLAVLREQLGVHQGTFVDAAVVGDVSKPAAKKPAKKKHEAKEAHIDKETRKQLEALGYMGD